MKGEPTGLTGQLSVLDDVTSAVNRTASLILSRMQMVQVLGHM